MHNKLEQNIPQETVPRGEVESTGIWCWLLRAPVQVGLILVLGLGIYLHTVHAPFILDDYLCILENPAIRNFQYLLEFDKIRDLNIWLDIKNNMALRPVAYWTFAFNYRLGGYNEFGYHLVNIAIHLLNAVAVYLLARATLGRMQHEWSSPFLASLVPLLTGLLFVAHPLQTQAVTYVNQRFTSLTTLFYLSALLLYINARTTRRPTTRWSCYVLALLITVVAMKTKAIAFTLPFMIFLYDYFFLEGGWRQRLRWSAPFALTLLVIPGTLYWLVATDGIDDPRNRFEQSINLANFTGTSQWDYLRTQFNVIVTYLRMFLLPVGQSIIPYFPTAPPFLLPGGGISSFLLLVLLVGGALYLARRALGRGKRSLELVLAFGILWFFITISMSSSVIPLDAMMLEYRVYLPSFGVILAMTTASAVVVDKGWLPFRPFIGGAVLILALFSATTFARNQLYNDRIAMMRDILEKNPSALSARVALAGTLLENRRFEEALAEYQVILKEIPDDPNMIISYGYALEGTGRPFEAIQQYQKVLDRDPANAFAHGNLGIAYVGLGWFPQAEAELKTALALDPYFGSAREQLASIYEKQGRIALALEQYRTLLTADPSNNSIAEKVRMLQDRWRQ